MINRMEISEIDVHAFVDGELDSDRRAAFEDAMCADEGLARRVAAFRADKLRIAETYGPLIGRPLPASLLSMIEEAPQARRGSHLRAISAIAASILLLVGATAIYLQFPRGGTDSIVNEALAARNDSLHPRDVVQFTPAGQANLADHAISSALGMRLKAPDLRKMGYRLAGIRIYDAVAEGKGVELQYRGAGNRAFALYVRHPSSAARFEQFTRNGLRVCIWQDDVIGMVMTGEMSAAEMQRLASLAYTGLES